MYNYRNSDILDWIGVLFFPSPRPLTTESRAHRRCIVVLGRLSPRSSGTAFVVTAWALIINHSALLAAGFRRANFDFRSAAAAAFRTSRPDPRRVACVLAFFDGGDRSMRRRRSCHPVQMTTGKGGPFVRCASVIIRGVKGC